MVYFEKHKWSSEKKKKTLPATDEISQITQNNWYVL